MNSSGIGWALLRRATVSWFLALATLSGAVTSGLGYALWYRVLRQTGAAQAAIVQLTVPVIAAIGSSSYEYVNAMGPAAASRSRSRRSTSASRTPYRAAICNRWVGS